MKILSTMRAGKVVRMSLYSPRDPNPRSHRRRGVSVSKEDRQRANLKTSYEKLLMRVCANFSPGDWWVTLTYDDAHLPPDRDASKKPWQKFMRRYRKYRKNNKEPLAYVYCTQLTTSGGGIRLHHHMILRYEDDQDRERIETLWEGGPITYCRKIKDFEELYDKCGYMCREPRELGVYVPGEQMWTASRGLVIPRFEYAVIDNDAADISVPTGCTALQDPVQLPGYGGCKTILYYDPS